MTDSSENSFNTNSYGTKVSLDDIDKFVHDIQNDTNDIIRDFHSNKLVMKKYFSDLSALYEGYEESILLLIYLVLCMKTKLMYLDKKIEYYVFNYLLKKDTQFAGTLDSDTADLLRKELPLSFESIYSQYATYKMRLIEHLVTTRSVFYLDEALSVPVTNITTQIVRYDEKNYFNSYSNFYDKIMMYIKNEVFQIEHQLRNNNLSEIYRYYVYRKIIEFDITEESYKNKNDILREYIIQNKPAYDIMKMLYGSIEENSVRDNIIDEFRTQVTEHSNSIILIMNILEQQISKIRPEGITYFSKTFDRLTNKVTKMLKHKQSGGFFLKNEVLPKVAGKPNDNTIFRERINKILYTVLRSADSRHDFLFDEKRPSPEFQKNKNQYLKSIKFIPKLEYTELGKRKENQKKDYEEILRDLEEVEIFGKKFVITESYTGQDINLEPLLYSMEKKNDFEDHIIKQMNTFIYNVCQIDFSAKDINIINEFLNVYRPGNFILDKILKSKMINAYLNTAQYINKSELFNLEQRDFDETRIPEIFNKQEEIDNLLFVIYDDSIISDDSAHKKERLEIITKVKKFFGTDSVKLLVDYGQKSGPFFEIFTKDDNEGKDVFILPKFSLAQEWDAASKRGYHLNKTEEPQILNTDLLDRDNNIPICEKEYKITLERKDDRVIAHAGINVYDLLEAPVPIDSKNFTPSVNILSNLISDKEASEDIRCKLFYLKNSGDWGQVTSANQNKSFLLSEDRLCSYYSFLTNTSTIYTIERGGKLKKKFITMLHRGDIDMSWQNIIEIVQKTLLLNNYYIFYENITITLTVTYISDIINKTDIYKISYTLNNVNVTYTVKKNDSDIINENINSQLKKSGDLKKINLTEISYTKHGLSVQVTDIINIKDESTSLNNSIPMTITAQVENHSSTKKEEEKCSFLVKKKCNDNYEKIIYSNFFDKFYPEILDPSRVKALDETTLDKLNRVVREEIIDYVSENIMIVYLSFLNSHKHFLEPEKKEECIEGNDCIEKDKPKMCTKKYKDVLTSFFNEINPKAIEKYKLEYINFNNELSNELTWKSIDEFVIDPEETYEKQLFKTIENQTKIRDESILQLSILTAELTKLERQKSPDEEQIYELTKNKRNAYLLKNYNPKITDYKKYNMSESKIINDLNLYKYNNSEQNVFISSMLTNGLWDIFSINPFIYSLYSKFLSVYPELIPTNLNQLNIKKIKHLYSFFDFDKIKPEISLNEQMKKKLTDLQNFITSEKSKYKFDINPPRALSDKEYTDLVIDYLNKGLNIYELSLFMYLYDFIIPTDFPEKNIFKILETKIEIANIKLVRDKFLNKIETPYVGEYLKMVKDLLPTEETDILVLFSDETSPIVLYFKKILEELDITKHKEMMILADNVLPITANYVTKLKEKEDVEYYLEIINILKSIKETLKNNEIYINEKDSIKTTVLWFIDILYGYLSDYDKIEYIKNINKFQYCKLTRQLLEKIKETIKDYPILKHIHNFLTEVLQKDLSEENVSNLFVIHSDKYTRCSNIVTKYNELYKDNAENSSECTEDSDKSVSASNKAEPLASEADEEAILDVVPAALEAVDDIKKKCVSLGSTTKRFIKDQLSSKIVELVTTKYPTINKSDLESALKAKIVSHELLCIILQLPADSEASLKDAIVNEAELNKIFQLPTLGGNIDYNKECQIM